MSQNFIVPTATTTLGANYDKERKCVHFTLLSKNATHVILCIFEKALGEDPVMNLHMKKRIASDIWETSVKTYALKDLKEPFFYGFRVFGPNFEYTEDFEAGTNIGFKSRTDKFGNRFNPNKLAFDPYSREISHLPSDVSEDLKIFRSLDDFNFVDNAKEAPKSVFYLEKSAKSVAKVELRPFSGEIIGEAHIKDLTRNLPIKEAGTYLGAAKFAPKIKEMGFTTVEFLPLMEFDQMEDGRNYWGYMTLGYFAPSRFYAFNKEFGKVLDEFRTMVDAFHKNDLKVCLDVVYNHTGEGRIFEKNNNDAYLLSYALIDNAHYYKLSNDMYGSVEDKFYRENSGCHNDTNINGNFWGLIADSVAFWANQGVDAFRFDLAAALMDISEDEKEKYDAAKSLIGNLTQMLQKRGVKVVEDPTKAQDGIVLIAEPWTCGGSDTYQLGNFPKNWLEWNDVSRDTIRRAALYPSHINLFDVKNIFEGTKTKFKNKYGAINYIACHDGFCLYDINSFSKRNECTTGGSCNEICNDNACDINAKENAIKKELTMLFFSKGVPMMQIGDAIMHTKGGNNNSYNHDDEVNYYSYEPVLNEGSFENRIFTFTRSLIKLRQKYKVFSSANFEEKLGYYDNFGQKLDPKNTNYFTDYNNGYVGIKIQNGEGSFFVAFSKSKDKVAAHLCPPIENKNWYILFDTHNTEHTTFEMKPFFGLEYIMHANSVVVFKEG